MVMIETVIKRIFPQRSNEFFPNDQKVMEYFSR